MEMYKLKALARFKRAIVLSLQLLFFASNIVAQEASIMDLKHYSKVMGEIRNYRVFLPPGYYDNPGISYPVIYYYHGWSQRYFGSIKDFKADEGDNNNGDNIANFVATHEVIVVKPDGYNRRINEEYDLRPYNIGPVETYRQFPLYFPELVNHVDASFRTIADRNHRAITGLSMGGFMTFWIAGMVPHLVSAAGNFCGSTEFVVGPIDLPVEYRHQDLYKNYEGMNVRLNYGDKDFIRAYHQDMNKVWTQVLDNYTFKVYDAAHSTCGLREMFGFFMETFKNPPPKPVRWHHADVYPSFSVWDYEVNSDRNVAGFTSLENVDANGFRSSVRSFLPDGELLPFVNLSVITSAIYEKNQVYQIQTINPLTGQSSVHSLKSDREGRLKIDLDGGLHEIGINKGTNKPNVVVASWKVENSDWVTPGKEVSLSVKLLNKGAGATGRVTAKLEPIRQNVTLMKAESSYDRLDANEISSGSLFRFRINNEVEMVRFRLDLHDDAGNNWSDFIDMPVRTDAPKIENFVIADGKQFAVAEAGDDTVSVFLGNGNGDGKVNPGESIVILVNDNGRYFRTALYTADQYINPSGIHIRKSDSWGTYDHVGGSAKYSVPVVASDCPENHKVKFFAEYWLPKYPDHIIKRGTITFNVEGKDQTAPELEWVKISGDNTIQAKWIDGGKISLVKAQLRLKEDPEKSFVVELSNKGGTGDPIRGDLFFSKKIQERGFGLYHVVIEAVDSYGNTTKKEWPEIMVVH